MAISAFFLAAKLEESVVRIRDLVNVFDYLMKRFDFEKEQLRSTSLGKTFSYEPMDYSAREYYDYKEELVICEMQLLKR